MPVPGELTVCSEPGERVRLEARLVAVAVDVAFGPLSVSSASRVPAPSASTYGERSFALLRSVIPPITKAMLTSSVERSESPVKGSDVTPGVVPARGVASLMVPLVTGGVTVPPIREVPPQCPPLVSVPSLKELSVSTRAPIWLADNVLLMAVTRPPASNVNVRLAIAVLIAEVTLGGGTTPRLMFS